MLVELEEFLSQLNSFRTNKKFCDVIFIVDDKKFYAHRAVLAANLEYFNAMFSDNYAERNNLEIPLKGISSTGFKVFLDFIYCYDVKLHMASVKDVLNVSLYYNTDSLTNKCFEFIKTDINANNVLEYYEFADSLSYDALKSYARSYLIRFLTENTRSLDDILADNSLFTLKNFITFSGANEVASNALRNWFNDGKVQQQGEFNRLFEVFRNVCSSSADCSEINNLMSIKKNIYVFVKEFDMESQATIMGSLPLSQATIMGSLPLSQATIMGSQATIIVPWIYDGSSIKHVPQMGLQSFFKSGVVSLVGHNKKAYMYAEHTDNSNFHYYCMTKDRWMSTNSRFPDGSVHQLASSDFDNRIYCNISDYNNCSHHVPDMYYYKVDLNKWHKCKISGYATADNKQIFGASLVSNRNCIFSCGGRNNYRGALSDTLMLDTRAKQWIRKSDTPNITFDDQFNPIAVLNDRLYLCNYTNLYVYDIRADKWLQSAKASKLTINYLIPYENTLHGLDANYRHFNIYDPVSDDWKIGPSFGTNLYNCCGALVI